MHSATAAELRSCRERFLADLLSTAFVVIMGNQGPAAASTVATAVIAAAPAAAILPQC
jgi:hypothetical protein